MARQRLRIGERGEIGHRQEGPKRWVARCLYRDSWGERRNLTARATTKAAATSALKTKWHNLSEKIITREEASTVVTFDVLADRYFAFVRNDKSQGRPLPRTIRDMESRYNNHLSPQFGEMTLEECTAGSLHQALRNMVKPDGGLLGTAHECRSLLVKFFDYAIQHGIVRHNVARSIPHVGYTAPKPVSWSDEQIENIRTALRYWMENVPNSNQSILDIYDMSLATGCRISEVLGLMWEDVYLPEGPDAQGWVHIQFAVLTRDKKTNVIGSPKGGKTKRLYLPQFGIEILQRLKPENATGLVFPNAAGNAFHTRSLYGSAERAFERARKDLDIDVPQRLKFHTSRKTVLSQIAETHGIESASKQGGHSTPEVTRRHYWDQEQSPIIDFASTLERFGKTEE
ncbi:MAG: tyrosine-type recombinase/integrase [Micrococcaceae bacterium]|nr:tyrosine-type recombinase/integrase [Micrococcaceae bacterium]